MEASNNLSFELLQSSIVTSEAPESRTTHNSSSFSFQTDDSINATSVTSDESQQRCVYVPPVYLEERFWLVTVVGTTVALISVVENLFLFFALIRKKQHRNSHCMYLLLLAFFDVFMGAAYVPLMSFSLLLDYLESVILLKAWYAYMTPLITISHIAMTSSSFLILAASFERYCITRASANKLKRITRYRRFIAAGAIFLGIITKSTLAAEFEIIFNEECGDTMTAYSLRLSSMALDHYYNLFWRLGFRNVVTVLLPFFLLLVLNIKIVRVLRDSMPTINNSVEKLSDVQRKVRVRAATRTLLMVVFTYLLANTLNVILTFWEYIDIESLTGSFIAFYTFGVDTVSILTILAGALRLPIYVTCMPQLRSEFLDFFKRLFLSNQPKKSMRETNANATTSTKLGYAFDIVRITEMLLSLPKLAMSTAEQSSACSDVDSDYDEGYDENTNLCTESLEMPLTEDGASILMTKEMM